jgi:hypothetical protein
MVDCGAGCAANKSACVTTTANMVMPGLELAIKITKSVPGMSNLESQFKNISQKMKQLANSKMDPREIAKQVTQMGTLPFEVNQKTMQWVNDYIGNFANMTNQKVFNELPKHFSGDPLVWVKQQYAKNHLALMLKSDGLPSPQNLLSQVTSFDPLQVDVVLGAFAKPICKTDIPFPNNRIIQQPHGSQTPVVTGTPAVLNLSGVWNCDDGGKYYVRQLGNKVWWLGERTPTSPAWSNVAHGDLVGNQLRLEWADVPKGSILQSGILLLEVTGNKMTAKQKTGGFGGSNWSR